METVARIRIRVADGKGIRATAREFGISRNTVRKALEQGETGFVRRKRKQRSSILDSFSDKTIYSVNKDEKPLLRTVKCRFDGYGLHLKRVNSMSQVIFDMNHYSVHCEFANKRVELRIYADKVVISSAFLQLVVKHMTR